MENNLLSEVLKNRQEYITDGYSMSIGEIVSNYKEGEIIINPIFQRSFRWMPYLKTKLIESILIGVPIPSIFVYQNDQGVWEVVDGVQRLSTIFEFMGELKDENNEKLPPSTLTKTKMLPSLEGLTWSKMSKEPLQIDFRRTKIEVKIIKSTSHKNAKFEVFQRLNYSSQLSGQEFRNALLVMLDLKIFNWLKNLSESESFLKCLDLSDRWKDEKYEMELVIRLFVFSKYADKPIYKIDDFLNEFFIYDEIYSIISLIEKGDFDLENESQKFEKTFQLLFRAKDSNVFKKSGRGSQFIESYFEAIAVGLYTNIDNYNVEDIDVIVEKINNIDDKIPKLPNSSSRIPKTVNFGKEYFKL